MNKTMTIMATTLAALLTLSYADAQAAAIQCTCSATMANLTMVRAARVSPPLDGAELRYASAGKCAAEVSDDGDKINGFFRSKVEVRSLRTKKSVMENDVVRFDYDKNAGSSLTTNYVSTDKDTAAKVVFEKKAQMLTMNVIDDLRYAPSDLTVPYTLRKGGKINIALTCPKPVRR
jgi:hypothetical protein